jgi:hypothetical protein
MEFWLSRSLSHELFLFHDGILAIKEPFTQTFSFSRWNSGYQGAFHTNFFLFHDGILAIKKPFTQTFSFSRWNSGYQGAFHTNFFFFHDGILAIKEPFSRTFLFLDGIHKNARLGGRLFSYIYHKEYLHRIHLVKNLAS